MQIHPIMDPAKERLGLAAHEEDGSFDAYLVCNRRAYWGVERRKILLFIITRHGSINM